jgi:hypothetical protein
MRKLVGLGMACSIPPNLNASTLFLKNKLLKQNKGKLQNENKIETKKNKQKIKQKLKTNKNFKGYGFLVHEVASVPLISSWVTSQVVLSLLSSARLCDSQVICWTDWRVTSSSLN